MLCSIFSYDFPKIRNLTKIFLRSFENVAPDSYSAVSIRLGLLCSGPPLFNSALTPLFDLVPRCQVWRFQHVGQWLVSSLLVGATVCHAIIHRRLQSS